MIQLFSFDFLSQGGWVAQVLALMSFVLWYVIGYRFLNLRTDSLKISPEALIELSSIGDKDKVRDGVAQMKVLVADSVFNPERCLYVQKIKMIQLIESHRQTIRAIVIVAPLLGLLGTVQGMIETFDSLQDSALFSQSGGIAGGISQALITTQMGLVVAIPGLLIGKKLDHKQKSIEDQLDRVMGLLLLKEGDHEVATS